ncbi:hypothetical protein [Aestuariivivens sediminicola]|uniref:hypothetical protein n=1 Tax=Aestuariivivens sediminicola TaxID=2913560 RepID=UPI001F5A0C47|nr:hypothetical protein [Aestuariivivens sediminicola]
MKTINKYLKGVTFFLATLVLIQGCTVYRTTPVTLEEATATNNKVKLKKIDNQTIKYKKIISINQEYFGVKKSKGDLINVPINKVDIKSIKIKNKPLSDVLSFLSVPVGVIVLLGIIITINVLGGRSYI